MIVDALANALNTRGLHKGIDAALDFLAGTSLDALPPGRRDVDGDRVYALVQEYLPYDPATRKFESHRRYIDVQYVQRGRELIHWAPISRLQRPGPYAADRDAILYEDLLAATAATAAGLEAGTFGIFFPEDAHMPGCRWGASGPSGEQVRKIVVKVLLHGT